MKEKKVQRGALFYAGFVLAICLAGVCLWQAVHISELSRTVNRLYENAQAELQDSFHTINTVLNKIEFSQNRSTQKEQFLILQTKTAIASNALSFLPSEREIPAELQDFLSQTEELFSTVSEKIFSMEKMDENEAKKLSQLTKTSTELCDTFFKREEPLLSSSAATVLKTKTVAENEALLPADKPVFTRDEARQVADIFLENGRSQNLAPNGETEGLIPTYDFVAQVEKNRTVGISITRSGGYVLNMQDNRRVTEQKLDTQDAVLTAKRFLGRQGMYYMRPCYYEVADNVATVTFVAQQQETVLQNDRIKVAVALDNGEVVGYDAKEYIMHHHPRKIKEPVLSLKKVQTFLNPKFSVSSAVLSLVPSDTDEVLCYAFCGTFNGKQIVVYMNAQTGEEERICLLPKFENGFLLF